MLTISGLNVGENLEWRLSARKSEQDKKSAHAVIICVHRRLKMLFNRFGGIDMISIGRRPHRDVELGQKASH
jgi:hypothetical protein